MSISEIPGNNYGEFADPFTNIKLMRGDFGPRVNIGKASVPESRGVSGNTLLEEYGRSGLRHWGGFVFEEWLRELQQGRRAAEVYREMMDQDPIIGAIMYAIQMLMRRVTWWVDAADDSPEAQQGKEWFESVMHDMANSWPDTIGEIISFLGYGWSYHEIVYKVRKGESRDRLKNSKFDDGTIGVAKLPLRSQDSLWKWVFDDVGECVGMIQNPPPDYLLRYIPREKSLLFRTTIFKDNPEGRSILRNAYRSWYFLRNIQNIEGIGMERDLAGLPVLTPPEGVDIWDSSDPSMANVRQNAQNVVSSIRRDEQEGILIPYGWELKLLSTGGSRQFDTSAIIGRYENRIATSVLADLVMMGQDKVGSYALAVTKKDLFAASLGVYLDIISSIINTDLIPNLWRINGFKGPMPKLMHGAVETVDLDTLGNYISRLGSSGAPIDWEAVLPWASEQAGIPKPKPGHDFTARNVKPTISDAPPLDRKVAKASSENDFNMWRDYRWEGS